MNPIAGGKKKEAILSKVTSALDSARFSYSVIYTEYAGHACEIARDCDADIVVAIGGDGTQNEVARGLIASNARLHSAGVSSAGVSSTAGASTGGASAGGALTGGALIGSAEGTAGASTGGAEASSAEATGRRKKMGIIPCGSGDGLALHLGISRNPAKAARTLCEGECVSIDYGRVNGHPFLCTSGVGIDAEVSWKFANAHSRGLHTYVLESIRTWFGFKPDNYRITVDGEEKWNGPATLVTVGNANQWGNYAKITPLASLKDGILDVTIVEKFHTLAFPGLLFRLMTGTAYKSRHAICLKGHKIHISRTLPGPLHYDGDPYSEGCEIDFDIVHKAIDVIVPKGGNI